MADALSCTLLNAPFFNFYPTVWSKVGHNFFAWTLGAILLVKVNCNFYTKDHAHSAFVLCVKVLVTLTPSRF